MTDEIPGDKLVTLGLISGNFELLEFDEFPGFAEENFVVLKPTMEPPIFGMSSNFVTGHDSGLLENGTEQSPFSDVDGPLETDVDGTGSEKPPPSRGSLVGEVKFPDSPVDLIVYNEDVTQEKERK